MERNEFIDEIMAVANEFGKAEIIDVTKPSESYTGIVIKQNGVPSPVVNVDRLYCDYQDGECSLEKCRELTRKILRTDINSPFEFNIKEITNWDIAKKQLFLRLSGTNPGGIYRKVADMFLIPYIRVTADDSAATRVIPQLLDAWEIDEEDLFRYAERNQETIRPAEIIDLATKVGAPFPIGVYIVTTKTGINGASAILYEGVLDDLYNRMGEFYLIPSSIHEMLAVPKEIAPGVDELVELVSTVNLVDVDEEDRLTNSIYEYDFDEEIIRKVG